MSIEREAPPAVEVRIKQLSERCAQLERLLESALLLTCEAINTARDPQADLQRTQGEDLLKWRDAVLHVLTKPKRLTPAQKLALTELCQHIDINAFMAGSHILVASTVDGSALERLAIALHTNPLSLSFGEKE